MDEVDYKILFETNKGLLLTAEPFNEIAAQLGITPQEVIARLVKLRDSGVIRRFGASIKPNDLGFSANALVAWKVPENRVQDVGSCLSKYQEVTHCYERKTIAGKWEYNLYTVMHARKREAIEQLVNSLSEATAVNDYLILYSTRDLKKAYARSTSTVLLPAEASVPSENLRGTREI
jgi:DNA-binding Lrp family transcriptional regulator